MLINQLTRLARGDRGRGEWRLLYGPLIGLQSDGNLPQLKRFQTSVCVCARQSHCACVCVCVCERVRGRLFVVSARVAPPPDGRECEAADPVNRRVLDRRPTHTHTHTHTRARAKKQGKGRAVTRDPDSSRMKMYLCCLFVRGSSAQGGCSSSTDKYSSSSLSDGRRLERGQRRKFLSLKKCVNRGHVSLAQW